MAKVTGGALVGKALHNEGVKTVFTLSGELSSMYDTCLEKGIELLDMRHEQAVANAATGYAMVTGKPGVTMVTAGPGVINMAPGVAAAFYACAPLVGCLGGLAGGVRDQCQVSLHPVVHSQNALDHGLGQLQRGDLTAF